MKFKRLEADQRAHLRWIAENKAVVLGAEVTVEEAILFVRGFDAALGNSLLRGFEEWLIVEIGEPAGFAYFWTGLVPVAIQRQRDSDAVNGARVDSVAYFFDLIDRFLEAASRPESTRDIYRRFEALRAQAGLS